MISTALAASMSTAIAAETVEIYSSIPVSGTGGQIGLGITQILNTVQDKREYKFVNAPGAQGDTSVLRAMQNSKLGQNVVIFNGVSTYTFNRLANPSPGFDRDKDLIYSVGIGKNALGIMINPDSPIKNLDELVSSLKKKEKSYFATTLTAPASIMLNEIFVKKYGLTGVQQINYKTPQEIILALQNKEADYTLFTVPDMTNLKAVLVSSDKRLVSFPDAPTAKEAGFDEFNLSSILVYAVPTDRKDFVKTFEEDMALACKNPKFEMVSKIRAPYLSYCLTPQESKSVIENELTLLNKYK